MYYSESGDEWKKFNTRDGMGIKLLQRAGIITAIVTQERTKLVARRAEKLAIPELHQGVMDKLTVIREMAARHGLSLKQVAYIGDDVNDLEALKAVGFSASPADGLPDIVAAVDYVCQKKGGEGAVREIIEMILDAQQQSATLTVNRSNVTREDGLHLWRFTTSRITNNDLISHLYPVIMAGGSGTRFWPLSRQLFPKQLLRIMGDETLIQQTMRRVVCASAPNRVMISTNPAQAESIRVQLSEWKDALTDNFVLEPEGRNTAPAIALVALELVRRDPDAMMLVVPADHIVKGQRAFDAAVSLAATLATQDYLVTFGIKPIRPETGYGYIKPNRKVTLGKQGTLKGHPVSRFVEKPNAAKAAQYLKAGDYYWNSGMFIWRAAAILDEIRRHQPILFRGIERIGQLMRTGGDQAGHRRCLPDTHAGFDRYGCHGAIEEGRDRAGVLSVV